MLAFGVAYLVGEPSVDASISIEEVPRSLQSTAGLLTGTALLGVALGGLVGVGAGVSVGRLERWSPSR